jgi:hypothetical protein
MQGCAPTIDNNEHVGLEELALGQLRFGIVIARASLVESDARSVTKSVSMVAFQVKRAAAFNGATSTFAAGAIVTFTSATVYGRDP